MAVKIHYAKKPYKMVVWNSVYILGVTDLKRNWF